METEYPKEKAYVTVIAYIKQLVQDGQLAFGGKLPSEREMMATLGLGRNSIREALRTLENMGLISCVHGKGNFLVNQIGESFSSVFSMLLFLKQSNFDEVQQLRRGLEMQSLLLAIQTADCTTAAAQAQWRQTLEPLGKLVESMRQATGHKRVTLDSAFHEALIQCSANRLFAVLQKAVSSLCEAAIENVLTAATDAQWQTLVDCHETIYQSLLNRDAQAGMAAIDQHYTQPFSDSLNTPLAMGEIPGIIRPELQALPQIKDRMTFLYLEHCTLGRQDGAITVTDEKGIVHIPAAAITVLLLGPGTRVTHRAMELMGDTGVGVVWVGEHGVRYYAHGRPLTTRAGLLQRQAELVSNTRKHVSVVRKMYQLRFPDEDVAGLTMQQLRGREGSRVRKAYRTASQKTGVPWNGREYQPEDFSASDKVNQALSAGHACLYGLAYAVIVSLGCSPGLGFVHVGHDRSFVYDIADLYKAEITIPIAFEVAAEDPEDLASVVRRRVRDAMVSHHTLERMVHDIRFLLLPEEEMDGAEEAVYLWDNQQGTVENGRNYAEGEEGVAPSLSSQ